MRRSGYLLVLIVLSTALVSLAQAPQTPAADSTLQNLNAAFNGESNAQARYLAFAAKADQENYAEIAILFRAAAKAEEVHARNFAAEVKSLGGTPQAKIETPVVKSTKENLELAIQGESYERDTMYPGFRKQAREAYNMDAVRAFNFAYNAEAEHANLFSYASNNMESMRGKSGAYYVCTVCGYTIKDTPNRACRSCYSSKDDYQRVS